MLGYNEHVYLSVSDVINKEGEKYIINMSLPNDFKYISFPDDVIEVTLSEIEQKDHNKRYNSFNILVGNVSTLEKLYEDNQSIVISDLLKDNNCIQVDDILCYYKDEEDNCVIFSKVEDGDMVVKDIDELEEKLMDISTDFEEIQKGIKRIKRYVYKK